MTFVSKFWTKDFSYGLAIDDFEYANLAKLLDLNFPNYERSTIIVNHHPQGSGGRISRTHEYYLIISSSKSPSYLGSASRKFSRDRNFMRSEQEITIIDMVVGKAFMHYFKTLKLERLLMLKTLCHLTNHIPQV